MSRNQIELERVSGGSGEYQERAAKFFNAFLPYQDTLELPRLATKPENQILNKLIPTYKFKLGKGLVDSARERPTAIIRDSIEEGKAVPLVANIGTSKWYDGTHEETNIVGLSELLMLEQLGHVDRRVKSVYEAGVKWTLLAEDTTNQWLYSQMHNKDSVRRNNETYLSSLTKMVDTVVPNLGINTDLVTESQLLEKNSEGIQEYLALLENNKQLFLELFTHTAPYEAHYLLGLPMGIFDQEEWNKYVTEVLPIFSAYQILCNLGWNGGVHPLQRKFYQTQFSKSGVSDERSLEYVAGYFGSVLARRQMKFAEVASGQSAIKVAFLRYPEGTRESEKVALTISQHPQEGYGSSHKKISPWAASTNLKVKAKNQLALSVRHARNTELPELDKLRLYYAGVNVPVNVLVDD